jgi:hypothetical protein
MRHGTQANSLVTRDSRDHGLIHARACMHNIPTCAVKSSRTVGFNDVPPFLHSTTVFAISPSRSTIHTSTPLDSFDFKVIQIQDTAIRKSTPAPRAWDFPRTRREQVCTLLDARRKHIFAASRASSRRNMPSAGVRILRGCTLCSEQRTQRGRWCIEVSHTRNSPVGGISA